MDRAILLLSSLNQGGPTTIEFATMEQCKAAEPAIVQAYREMTGNPALTRRITLALPGK